MQSPRHRLQQLLGSSDDDDEDLNSKNDGDGSVFGSQYFSPEKKQLSISPRKGSPSKAAAKKELAAKKREFDEKKVSLAENFIKELDNTVTGGEIQKLSAQTGGIKIIWSKKLNTTAGRANWKGEKVRQKKNPSLGDSQEKATAFFAAEEQGTTTAAAVTAPDEPSSPVLLAATPYITTTIHHATIELAEKVIDSEDRLFNTMAHEYCHLANYMISRVRNNPHGTSFKAWASKCMKALASHPIFGSSCVHITTKHSYAINFKYLWCCEGCGKEYGRHSRSIDPKKSRCGICKGILVQVRPKPRRTAAATKGAKSKERRDSLGVENVAVSMGNVHLG